jgi:hypothetical protein
VPLQAQVLIEIWRITYNILRPHSALGYLTPADYAKAWITHHPERSYQAGTNNRGSVVKPPAPATGAAVR